MTRAFANPEIYEFLEAEGMGYTIRLPANRVLQERIGYLLKRPVGRPPQGVRRYFASFSYQAQSWKKARRVVAKVEWHPGELCRASASSSSTYAQDGEAVVVDQPARQADQDRRQGHQPRPLRRVPEMVAVSREMFQEILMLIARLRAPPAPA